MPKKMDVTAEKCRRVVSFAIVIGVAAVHVLGPGTYLSGTPRRLYAGYASDVLLPLAMYFVLHLSERNLGFLKDWKAKAAGVFVAASAAEILQGFGIHALGRTFDPLDFVMYLTGVLLAVLLDRFAITALCSRRSARSAESEAKQ